MKKQGSSAELTIGDLAKDADVNVQTVRYYERRGLLVPTSRKPSGYRAYDSSAINRLRFIRRAQELGFTLSEIKELLSLRLDPGTTAAEVKERAVNKMDEIDEKIRDLEQIREALGHLAGRCRGGRGPTGDCPFLDALGPIVDPMSAR